MTTLETSLTRLITKDPTILNENANKDSNTFSTMRDLTAGTVSKSYALDHLLPKHVAICFDCNSRYVQRHYT